MTKENEQRKRSLAALRGHVTSTGALGPREKLRGVYLHTDRDDEVAVALEEALGELALTNKTGARIEGRGVAILAESGAGKTECVDRALRLHPLLSEHGVNEPGCRALSVTCLGSCTLRVLGEMLLRSSGYDVKEGLRENVVWDMVRTRLETLGILVVHIDEVNNLIENSNENDRQRVINNFKALINNRTWPVVLVISGTPNVGPVFQHDEQLRRRVDWLQFHDLRSPDDNEVVAFYLEALGRTVGISTPSDIETNVAPRLIHAARRQLGTAAQIGVKAVERAMARGSAILSMEDFATVYARRTGCQADENPFVVDTWSATNIGIVLSMTPLPESEDEGQRGRGKPRKARQRKDRGAFK